MRYVFLLFLQYDTHFYSCRLVHSISIHAFHRTLKTHNTMLRTLHFLAVLAPALLRGESDSDLQSVEVGVDGEVRRSTRPKVDCGKVDVRFDNRRNDAVEFYWVHPNGKDVSLQGTLQPGDSQNISSYIGHRFYLTPIGSKGSRDRVLHEVVMEKWNGSTLVFL